MRKILLALVTLAWAGPAGAQISANLPVTCSTTDPVQCVRATPVANPDGTTIGGGGGGPSTVVGNVAVAATDSGNPVKVGGVYNATPPTYTTGQRADLQTDPRGSLNVTLKSGANAVSILSPGADASLNTNIQLVTGAFQYNFNGTSWDRQRGDTTGQYVVSKGSATLATGQVSIGTTSTLLVAARTGRQSVTLTVTAATACSFGNTGVTTTTGFPLQPIAGASVTLSTSAAIYGACASATTVGYIENY